MTEEQQTWYDLGFFWATFQTCLAFNASEPPSEKDERSAYINTAAAYREMRSACASDDRPLLPSSFFVDYGLIDPAKAAVVAAEVEIATARRDR